MPLPTVTARLDSKPGPRKNCTALAGASPVMQTSSVCSGRSRVACAFSAPATNTCHCRPLSASPSTYALSDPRPPNISRNAAHSSLKERCGAGCASGKRKEARL